MNGGKNQLCSIQSINSPIKKTIYSLVCVKNAAKTKFFNIFDTSITLDLAEKVSNYLRFGWISICIYRVDIIDIGTVQINSLQGNNR